MGNKSNAWLWLTVPIAALLAIASGIGVFVGSFYRDTPTLIAQAIGQDLITLFVAVPALLFSSYLTNRGSGRARMVWLGGLVYVVYTYVGYAFDIRFNSLFLVYVALLGLSTYALIGGLVSTDIARIRKSFSDEVPIKAVSIYLIVISILFYLMWLSEAFPASLSGTPPQSLIETGTPTNFIHVLDMAWILPAVLITAFNLWRKQTIGYTLAGMLLAYLILLSLAILSMVVYMMRAGQSVGPQLVIFGGLFGTSTGTLIWYLGNFRQPHLQKN